MPQSHPASATCFLPGKLHFVKFETAKVDECIAFIEAKGACLHTVPDHRTQGDQGACLFWSSHYTGCMTRRACVHP